MILNCWEGSPGLGRISGGEIMEHHQIVVPTGGAPHPRVQARRSGRLERAEPPDPARPPDDSRPTAWPAQPIAFAAAVVQRSYQLWLLTKARFSPTERQRLFSLTILIGGVCGLVAGGVSPHPLGRVVTIEPAFEANGDIWIAWAIAVPTLGAVSVMLCHLPGARGSGVP
ncbi:MAG: hypothetical protein IPL61_29080 [Myxococcales bacterium]|nr:hypothetical protein [Myxococcales bacterium]